MKVLTFEQALKESSSAARRHLLLGNGFSIALRPKIFTYGSLLENADFSAAPEISGLFELIGTQDFEIVIKRLMNTVQVLQIYVPTATKTIEKLTYHAEVVKDALVTAVASRHPDRPYDIDPSNYIACRKFLSQFNNIYTLNYDVLLYWTLMQSEVDNIQLRPDDGFRHPDTNPASGYVSWQEAHAATIHYLHGALHLFDAGTEMIKYTWSRTDIPIVEQIRSALAINRFPLFVAEGDSASKLDKILHNAYLHKSLRSIESVCDNSNNSIVVFGHSLAANDEHVLRLIARGKVPTLLVSVYGSPDTPANKAIEKSAEDLVSLRSALRERYPLRVIYYDSTSAKVWG